MVDQIGGVGGMGNGGPVRKVPTTYHLPGVAREPDQVEISAEIQNLQKIEGIRLDKVLEVRRAIQNGTYVTPEKLNIALDRAIDQIEAEERERKASRKA